MAKKVTTNKNTLKLAVNSPVSCSGFPLMGTPAPAIRLTKDQIAQRAWAIWQAKGCSPGQDEQNWHEAEVQLRTELDQGRTIKHD